VDYDRPGIGDAEDGDTDVGSVIFYMSARQYVTVTLPGRYTYLDEPGQQDEDPDDIEELDEQRNRCSDYTYWHALRTTDQQTGDWQESPAGVGANDVGDGVMPWPLPPSIEEFSVKFVSTTLQNGTEGTAYSEDVQVAPPTAYPDADTYITVDSGFLPPGLTIDSEGHISGTPGQSGTYTFMLHASATVDDPNPPKIIPDFREFTIVIEESP
jgi:hypothetical protein